MSGSPQSGGLTALVFTIGAGFYVGCVGAITGSDPAPQDLTPPATLEGGSKGLGPVAPMNETPRMAAFVPGSPGLRMLTVMQYENAIHDLLGAAVVVPPVAGWQTALQGGQGGVSPQLAEQLEAASMTVAKTAFADRDGRVRLVGCDPTADECSARFLKIFLRRAWRRPATSADLTRWTDVARGAAKALSDPWRGLEAAVAGLLQSPNFLYRTELGEPKTRTRLRRFSGLEMASRLSFFLWNAPPDDALLDAAERGDLATAPGLVEQTRRLLGSPRARQGLRGIFDDALDLHSLPALQKDTNVFPTFGPGLAEAMRQEIVRTLDDHLFVRNADVRDLFVRRETFVNNALAKLYLLPTQAMDGFRAATWPANTPRAGLLGFAGLLSLQANQLTASPTLRGKHVREAFLCLPMPPPPPGVDTALPPVNGAQKRTTRQRLSEHQKNVTCAGCHALMDPIGFALETFDAVGSYRAQENGLPIDTSGQIDGVAFKDAAGLGQALRDHPAVDGCLARQMYRYALGRFETPGEDVVIKELTEALAKGQHQISSLAEALVTSEWFAMTGEVTP